METNIPMLYALLGLALASALLTYFTHQPTDPTLLTEDVPPGRLKKAKKVKSRYRLPTQQPYLLADGTVILASQRPQPVASARLREPAAVQAEPLPHSLPRAGSPLAESVG